MRVSFDVTSTSALVPLQDFGATGGFINVSLAQIESLWQSSHLKRAYSARLMLPSWSAS